jgi:hypothetical protein
MFRLFATFILNVGTLAAADLSPEELTLSAQARGVFAHHCTKCHG